MHLFETVDSTRRHAGSIRQRSLTLGFVPTMGALHEGHLSLVRRALEENDCVAVSIFVNPIQFNNTDDLRKYPRTLERDLELLRPLLGVEDFVFAPTVEEMYPEPSTRIYDFGPLATVMEGRFRPGHFNGVGVVVDRLFRIVGPDAAYFGEKDFQQLAIIRRLAEIEGHDIRIVACPIIREADGLAMSSRNVRLTPNHRRAAPEIFRILTRAVSDKTTATPDDLRKRITNEIDATGLLKTEYVDFADERTLAPAQTWDQFPAIRCFVAVHAGEVRLIDNVSC
jgi:pantoate--beta-alanine ligase